MAVKVYLGGASAAQSTITYEEADAFSVTAAGFLLIQRKHSGEQKDLAVFAPRRVAPRGSRAGAASASGFAVTYPVSGPSRRRCAVQLVAAYACDASRRQARR